MHPDSECIPYNIPRYGIENQLTSAQEFRALLEKRRSVRQFSSEPVPAELIRELIMTASTAPSGANKQPWHFCAISSPQVKKEIRLAAEREEYLNYSSRMSEEWKQDLKKLRTNWEKAFLEEAPWLIAVFMENYGYSEGNKHLNYYVKESVGLATGMLLAAIFHAGLASLTYTPSPMQFLSEILHRPPNEKPYLLIPVGYPATNARVPDITRKKADEVLSFF